MGRSFGVGRPSRLSEQTSEVQDVRTPEYFPQELGIFDEVKNNIMDVGHLILNKAGENNKLRHEMSLNLAPIVHEAEAGGVARVGADE